ncbi:MAG TPA: hypothetical protein VFR47_22635 [Anaerolineales bacterium]|nr:hypothetical protein [Anaerolineales bacterium]
MTLHEVSVAVGGGHELDRAGLAVFSAVVFILDVLAAAVWWLNRMTGLLAY